jgi:hypothetical protein
MKRAPLSLAFLLAALFLSVPLAAQQAAATPTAPATEAAASMAVLAAPVPNAASGMPATGVLPLSPAPAGPASPFGPSASCPSPGATWGDLAPAPWDPVPLSCTYEFCLRLCNDCPAGHQAYCISTQTCTCGCH